ncbi:hypothetical protein NMY22_g6283 [Coprinellus aureogranulatus]|nr:hypothetical protein NMY22_g6283 [Coprinellus aureogranulatus]
MATTSLDDNLDSALEVSRGRKGKARADRRVAELLTRGRCAPRLTEAQEAGEPRVGPRYIPKLGEEGPFDSIWRLDDLSESLPKAGLSIYRYKRVDCVGCDTKLRPEEAVLTSCDHYWCTRCLKGLIEVYLRDESLHPLRCCKNQFALPTISTQLSSSKHLLDQYAAKKTEYEVPAQNRVYCSQPTCSAFLGSSEAQPVGQPDIACHKCYARTCATCRSPSHAGNRCKENEAVDQVRALAPAAQSSASSAGYVGRIVIAPSGTKNGY